MNPPHATVESEPDQITRRSKFDLDRIWEAIWTRRPVLGEIMRRHATKNLFEYTKDFLDVNPSPRLDSRKSELVGVVHEILEKRLGKHVAEKVAAQLTRLPLVSTTDHHAPLQHPFFVNSNIVSALPLRSVSHADLAYLIVLSFASTSLNNASAFACGLLFHGKMRGSQDLTRLSIYSDKEKMAVTYGVRAFGALDIEKALSQLHHKVKEGKVSESRAVGLRALLEKDFGDPGVLASPNACVQFSKLTYRLWPRMFAPETPRVPDLIYLEIETLVTELLLRYHLPNPQSLLYKLLFRRDFYPLIYKHFDGIPGAFSTQKGFGSFLFWALDDKLHRVRLKLDPDGGNFASTYRTLVFPTEPLALAEALRTKKIFPGMFLCYLVVSLYYGFKCLGGFCQVNDLTRTKLAWQGFLREIGEKDEAQAVTPVQTKELGGDGMVLAYLKTLTGELIPATGIDLVLQEDKVSLSGYIELAKRITFREIMDPLVPEIYKVLFTVDERVSEYVALRPEEILEATGLKQKIEKFY